MFVRFDEVAPLAEGMVSKMDSWLFDSEVTTFVDPAISSGSYLKAVEERLLFHGHSKINISNRLFGYCSSQIKKNNIVKKFGIEPQWIDGSFLESNMKFDVIIGNPPYQNNDCAAKNNKLWKAFSEKAIDLSPGVIAYVTPNSVFKDVDSNGKHVRNFMVKNNYGLVDFQNHGFDVFKGIGVETSHWIISKESKTLISEAVFSNIHPLAQSICDKVTSYSNKLTMVMENGHVGRNQTSKDSGNNEILFSGNKVLYTNEEVSSNGLKLVMPFSSSYHSMFITDKPTGMLNMVTYIESKEEGQAIIDYAITPLFMLVANTYKKTSGFTPFVKNCMVPDLRKKDITNIYNIFELTQEEIDYVEQNS